MAQRATRKAAKKTLKRRVARRRTVRSGPSKRARVLAQLWAMYDAYKNPKKNEAQQIATIFAPIADEAVLIEHASPARLEWGGRYVGRQAWLDFFAKVNDALHHSAYECQDIQSAGDWVFAWGYFDVKCRQSDRTSRLDWQHRIRLSKGKVVELHEFYDSMQVGVDIGRV